KVRDVMQNKVLSVAPEATTAEALGLMEDHNLRVVPVLDAAQRCLGLVSLFKVSQFLFPTANRLIDSRRVLSSLQTLARTLGGSLVVGHEADQEQELVLTIGAMGLDSFAQRLEQYSREKLAVVVGDRWDIQNLAIREGVRVLIVTGGLGIEPKTLEAARRNRVSVISSPHDTATTADLCRASIAVRHVLREEFLALREDAPLREAKTQATASGFLTFPVVDAQQRTVGILSKTDFLKKVDRKLILVDHNELSQAVQGAAEVEILEIIDHHRIGSLTTQQPILFRNEPVGSTSTIVADCFFRYGVELPRPIAGLLLAGLAADTLNLTSPTTTAVDKEILSRLEKIAGVSAREFTERLFASGSLLTHKPAPQAITTDCKEYEEGGVRFSVAQIEEIGFTQFWQRKSELLQALENYRNSRQYQFSALLVTDVTTHSSLLLLSGDSALAAQINYPRVEPGIYELNDIVSRKKQLLPYLTHCLQQLQTRA
ncbi:MAG TPA: putative manganese-dependent inorganic diphosphatase, partial [Candidatus Sulfotelmatobacter sp.]|nr:putative manganese-dependent inorganic diphosphatase [Candidatus Sulfotelmatobacter sp.]